jgi:hypothetical protein
MENETLRSFSPKQLLLLPAWVFFAVIAVVTGAIYCTVTSAIDLSAHVLSRQIMRFVACFVLTFSVSIAAREWLTNRKNAAGVDLSMQNQWMVIMMAIFIIAGCSGQFHWDGVAVLWGMGYFYGLLFPSYLVFTVAIQPCTHSAKNL